MLVMGVRNIRKYAPHAVQKEVTRKVADMLRQENLYRPAEDDACLSRREGELLKAWMGGKSGLDFSYYWKKMRKAGAGCCAANITRMDNPMKKNEFAVVLASDNRGILPLSVTVFSLLNTAGPETFYKIYVLSDGIDGENPGERGAAGRSVRLPVWSS